MEFDSPAEAGKPCKKQRTALTTKFLHHPKLFQHAIYDVVKFKSYQPAEKAQQRPQKHLVQDWTPLFANPGASPQPTVLLEEKCLPKALGGERP